MRNRGIEEEFAAGRASYKGLLEMDPGEGMAFKNTANTNIVWHAGKLMARQERRRQREMAMATAK